MSKSGSKVWEALNREIGEPGYNRSHIFAHWEFQSTATLHHRKNRRDLRSGLRPFDVDPIPSTKSCETHRVFRQIVAQLQFGIFQKAGEFFPERHRVVAGFGERTGWQRIGSRGLDLLPDHIQQRSAIVPGVPPDSALGDGPQRRRRTAHRSAPRLPAPPDLGDLTAPLQKNIVPHATSSPREPFFGPPI